VLISGFGTLETAIDAVRAGAFDYISKPFDIADIKRIVDRAIEQRTRRRDFPAEMPASSPGSFIGRTAPMLEVYKQIAHGADSAAPVLIVGESGVGKELVARAIHDHGVRGREPFVAINCGAIADTLLESELFGHQRGAFTGAVADHKGVFEQAGKGTVLLDEIGDTTPALQVRLLRVLEEGEVRPVGGSRSLKVSPRVIAATNVPHEQSVADNRFRQDLYYRLSVIVIRVPPLRERRADIPLLIGSFFEDACVRAGKKPVLSAEALEALMRHTWPGISRGSRCPRAANKRSCSVSIACSMRVVLRHVPLPRHPFVVRDLSIVVDDALPAEIIRGTIQAAGAAVPAPMVSVRVFDRYEGKGVPNGRVSLSVRLTFQSADRTLTDAEVQQSVDAILAALVREHGAVQR